MESLYIFLIFAGLCVMYGRAAYMVSPRDCVIAGTSSYQLGFPRPMVGPHIKGIKHKYLMFADAMERGPICQNPIENDAGQRYWDAGDVLAINQDFDFEKGGFYLCGYRDAHMKRYRIVQCIANSYPMPPIFNDSSTMLTHQYFGRVIAVIHNGEIDYRIGKENMIIPTKDWK